MKYEASPTVAVTDGSRTSRGGCSIQIDFGLTRTNEARAVVPAAASTASRCSRSISWPVS